MNIWDSILEAFGNVRAHKMRSFLTIIGIVVGVAAVIAVISIGQAGKSAILSDIEKYGDNFFVVMPDPTTVPSNDTRTVINMDDLKQIERMTGIQIANGSLSLPYDSKSGKDTDKFTVTGTMANFPKAEQVKMKSGRFFETGEERAHQRVIVVDEDYAKKRFGSASSAVGRKMDLQGKPFRIVGVFETDKSLLGDLGPKTYSAYVPFASMPMIDDPDSAKFQLVEVKAKSSADQDMQKVMTDVKKLLAKRHNVPVNHYMTQTGAQAQEQVSSIFNILQVIIGSIAGISLLVEGIGVMNIMLVSVTERTREIGIRKAIGATPGNIMGQFLIEAVTLSFIGGAIGTLIFSLATDWSFMVSGWTILLAFGFSATVGIFFGIYPANKASRMQPIESLRYE